jgi:hypothetical protein
LRESGRGKEKEREEKEKDPPPPQGGVFYIPFLAFERGDAI